jgi:SHS2 domain-containing protein
LLGRFGWPNPEEVFETLDHTGDLALRIRADRFTELVAEGIRGIGSLLFEGEPDRSASPVHGRARVSGVDREDALVQALSEALYWMQEGSRFPLEVRVLNPEETVLEIELDGVAADGRALRHRREIKAVTYHNLEILEKPDGYETVVVLDV